MKVTKAMYQKKKRKNLRKFIFRGENVRPFSVLVLLEYCHCFLCSHPFHDRRSYMKAIQLISVSAKTYGLPTAQDI